MTNTTEKVEVSFDEIKELANANNLDLVQRFALMRLNAIDLEMKSIEMRQKFLMMKMNEILEENPV